MDDDMDDPMAKASPRPASNFPVNGLPRRDRGPGMRPGLMVDMSMDDDIIDPISVSMEMTDNRDDQRAKMRASPGNPYQSDHGDQRHATMPQYRPQVQQQHQQPSYMEQQQSQPEREWVTGVVRLERTQRAGFGLAVVGGVDKPLASGETSIVVSDILARGPADGKLKKEDRLLSVNRINMKDVQHATAVGALRNAGDSVVIEYRRWSALTQPDGLPRSQPPITRSQTLPVSSAPPGNSLLSPGYYGSGQRSPGLRGSQLSLTNSQGAPANRETITLNKSRNEGFGLQLGWKVYVQGLSEYGVAASQGLNKGDTIVKINGYAVETLSLADARRIMQTSGNSLNLEIVREPQAPVASTPEYNTRADRLSIGTGDARDYPSPRLPRAGGDYDQKPPPQQQHYQQQQQQQQPRDFGQWEEPAGLRQQQQQPPASEFRSPFPGDREEPLSYEQDDPLNASLPPRPPLPGEGQQRGNFSMPPPRPPSPARQEFMGRSTAL